MIDMKSFLAEYNKSYDVICRDFKVDFDSIKDKEREWQGNLEDKTHLLNNTDDQHTINKVISILKSEDDNFSANDTPALSTFIIKINRIVSIADRINNFKNGTAIANGQKLHLFQLFNEIKRCNKLSDFGLTLNSNLDKFLPHLFSVIKHCQNPNEYPIYYKYWKNILREVFSEKDDYDRLCDLYRGFPVHERHLNFAAYFGTIGTEIAKAASVNGMITTTNSKEYKHLTDRVINIEEYKTILTENLTEPNSNPNSIKYWLYAPGRNAFLWDEFYDQGIMGLGWDKLGDLNNYSTKEEISLKLQELTDSSSDPKNNSTANYEFKNVISEGDIIITKRGRGELIGYGIVTSDYYYDNNRSSYHSCRKVDWKKKGSWKTDFSLVLKTLTDVTKYTTDHPEYEFYYERLMGIMDDKKEYQLKFPLNTIFYGPPGTGKTYNTVLKAAQIIENKIIDNFKEAQEIFNQNLGDRIEFITFHQNYSYEDFIQGIRPDVESGNNLFFEKKDGVFTRIAVDALFEYFKEYKKINISSNMDKKLDVNEIYLDFIENLKSSENKEYETISGSKVFIHTINKNDNIEFKHHNSSRTYLVSSVRLLKLFHVYTDIKDIKNLNNDIRDVIGGCNATVYWVALKEFINFYNSYQTVSIEDVKDEYEEVGYETKKKLISTVDLYDLRKVQSTAVKKYVIIIDEINRANISRVFGELITLIEPDKRSHGLIPLTCTLPSSDSFIIPSNLYIIGTMNTADKSIALLDIALRRRFEFESMYPLYEIDGMEIFDVDILQKINEKIIKKKGHDFQIGHSYFMGDNIDLTDRMNNKVIPLLLEYFMNDEKEVKEILSSAGLTIKQGTWPLEIDG